MPTKARLTKSLRSDKHLLFIGLLTTARKNAGLTQQQLADRLHQPQSFVAKYEGGERRIDVIEYLAIAAALELDPVRTIRQLVRS